MRRRTFGSRTRPGVLRGFALALLLVTVGAGVAVAQNEQPNNAEEVQIVPAPSATLQGPPLTGEQQIARADSFMGLMQTTRHRVMGLLDEARRARDIIKATCLNDKLTQINGNIRVAEDRVQNLHTAVQSNDEGRRTHEYTILVVVRQKVDSLGIEADQCIGEERWYTGATRVETRIDAEIPEEDTTRVETPVFIIERPPAASGYY